MFSNNSYILQDLDHYGPTPNCLHYVDASILYVMDEAVPMRLSPFVSDATRMIAILREPITHQLSMHRWRNSIAQHYYPALPRSYCQSQFFQRALFFQHVPFDDAISCEIQRWDICLSLSKGNRLKAATRCLPAAGWYERGVFELIRYPTSAPSSYPDRASSILTFSMYSVILAPWLAMYRQNLLILNFDTLISGSTDMEFFKLQAFLGIPMNKLGLPHHNGAPHMNLPSHKSGQLLCRLFAPFNDDLYVLLRKHTYEFAPFVEDVCMDSLSTERLVDRSAQQVILPVLLFLAHLRSRKGGHVGVNLC